MEISTAEVKQLFDAGAPFGLVDCRTDEERQTAAIEPAQFIPMNQIQARISEIEAYRDSQLVVYCHHGGRSLMVVEWLRGQGFSQAQSMTGGIDEWSTLIDPNITRYQ